MKKRIVTEDTIVTVETIVTEESRTIDYAEVYDSVCVKIDDWMNEPPWGNCDGWEHEFHDCGYYGHNDARYARAYVSGDRNRPAGFVVIDDDTVTKKWGCTGYPGASKQVRAELIASVKRSAIDQLVKWYRDGWQYYQVLGDYNGYTASVCGIDCPDYAEETRHDIAAEIVDQLERDDFIVVNQPVTVQPSKSDRYRINRYHRNNSYIVKTA